MTDPSPEAAREWWSTEIIDIEPGSIRVRGYPIEQLIGEIDFPQMVWLMLRGEVPGKQEAELLGAMLVAGVDHGPHAPSIAIARMAMTCGIGINNAMASAANVLGDVHGGAGEQLMELFAEIVAAQDAGMSTDEAVRTRIDAYQVNVTKYVPGFGHRFHPRDPRGPRLLALVERARIRGDCGRSLRRDRFCCCSRTGTAFRSSPHDEHRRQRRSGSERARVPADARAGVVRVVAISGNSRPRLGAEPAKRAQQGADPPAMVIRLQRTAATRPQKQLETRSVMAFCASWVSHWRFCARRRRACSRPRRLDVPLRVRASKAVISCRWGSASAACPTLRIVTCRTRQNTIAGMRKGTSIAKSPRGDADNIADRQFQSW